MGKIYLVTAGSYSEYRIIAAYSTKKKAQFAKKLYGADYVEAFEIDKLPEHTKDIFYWVVRMNRNGDCLGIETQDITNSKLGQSVYAECYKAVNGEKIFYFDILAKDKEHAIKICNDKRLQMIAEEVPEPEIEDEWAFLFNETKL